MDWFRATEWNQKAEGPLKPDDKAVMQGKTERKPAFLLLKNVSPSDSGFYYCQVNGTRGAGTGLQVMSESLWVLVPGGPKPCRPV